MTPDRGPREAGENGPAGPDEGPAPIPQDVVELLAEAVDLEDPVEVVEDADGMTYRLAGRPFAHAAGLVFEVHLGREIAEAALRTPDAGPSTRGSEWVRLGPARIDDHAADRVVAWFEMGRRIAAGRRPPPQGGERRT